MVLLLEESSLNCMLMLFQRLLRILELYALVRRASDTNPLASTELSLNSCAKEVILLVAMEEEESLSMEVSSCTL